MSCQKATLVFIFCLFYFWSPAGPVWAANTSAKKGVGGEGTPDLTKLGVSWAYTWYICQTCFTNTGYEHVPMIWGRDYDAVVVTRMAQEHSGSPWLIWNEPNYWRQANLSPTEAAQIYRVLRPLIKNVDPTAKLIVGGVLWLDTGWLGNFRSEYHRLYNEWPVVEGWHVHHYVGATEYGVGKPMTLTAWRQQLEAVKNWMISSGGLVELWLTEFGCLDSEPIAYQVMRDQVSWLEAQSWLTRYAWYASWSAGEGCPNCTGALFEMTAPYNLTRLGQYYASVGQSATPTISACLGDLDGSGAVGEADLVELNRCYRPLDSAAADCQAADLNNNGVVNALDYSILLIHWGNCP